MCYVELVVLSSKNVSHAISLLRRNQYLFLTIDMTWVTYKIDHNIYFSQYNIDTHRGAVLCAAVLRWYFAQLVKSWPLPLELELQKIYGQCTTDAQLFTCSNIESSNIIHCMLRRLVLLDLLESSKCFFLLFFIWIGLESLSTLEEET